MLTTTACEHIMVWPTIVIQKVERSEIDIKCKACHIYDSMSNDDVVMIQVMMFGEDVLVLNSLMALSELCLSCAIQ